ncbi:MAG TPA: histidine phosphatase family protein [Candidatus Agrococcus pullicola]|uniref:Histidine phosphatase family protein n=1 Tax=Candidatus Agrococcus pullicola TaxID=2838429 RepID=A0A9D1YTL0_9MICO|nr:histidine phosphatase family protein [Candidatus Agrococcus pullicola]
MQHVLVVTHPEATHHVDGLVGGWFDGPLTERGLYEAGQIAKRIRHVVPHDAESRIVASDLLRTRQTADAIGAELDAHPMFDAGLREKSYGDAEGRPQRWLSERFIHPPRIGDRLHHDEGIDNGETKLEWIERVYAAVETVEETPADFRIIVTHAGTANWVIAAWMRIPVQGCSYAAFNIPSGSITMLREDDVFHNRTLVDLGDRSFLRNTTD